MLTVASRGAGEAPAATAEGQEVLLVRCEGNQPTEPKCKVTSSPYPEKKTFRQPKLEFMRYFVTGSGGWGRVGGVFISMNYLSNQQYTSLKHNSQ